jgi:ribosomal-protein-alanine N-acetyltransferase
MRPWREGDVAAVREAFADPGVHRWHVLRIDDDAEALDWIAQWPGRWAEEEAASWAIVADDGPLEGTLRGSMLHADGWHDAHSHARLSSD